MYVLSIYWVLRNSLQQTGRDFFMYYFKFFILLAHGTGKVCKIADSFIIFGNKVLVVSFPMTLDFLHNASYSLLSNSGIL